MKSTKLKTKLERIFIFKLAPETIKYLRSMDLSNLEDGFHVNNAKHCAALVK